MAQPGPSAKAPTNAKILYSGVLMKKGEYHRSWKERWFVLFDNRQLLYYHGRDEFQDSKPCIAVIDLKQVTAIQPVASIDTPTGKKSSKKGGGFWSSSSKDKSNGRDIVRSQSMRTPSNGSHQGFASRAATARGYHTEDSIEHSATMTSITSDSPIPSLPQQNSLRMSFKSLMGKKSTGKNKPDLSERSSNNSRYNGSRLGTNGYNDDYEDSFGDGSDMNELPARDSSGNLNIRFKAEFPFEIVTPSRTYLLCCLDAYSFNDWLEHLRNVTFGKKIYGGWLTKQGSKNKSWKKRWFVIFDTREIRYYETEKAAQEKGSIILDDLQIMNLLEDKAAKSMYKKKNVFELVCGGRKWVLVANSKEERELWFNRVVQVVPSVQRLDPLYSNELSYKRNDRAKKWMKGYFAMDPEYLFFFKNKHSFDMFKSSAYFQEDLYTLALAQHVQGLIPLRNRKIKELDRNHPACSGKNKFVFSLKTSAGEFFLSTQYSIQMDDWLDAFRELYRLEIQEKRQGVISKRRKHSNSFGRRPPSPPSRAGSQYSNGRSISPAPSETSHHFGAATMEDDEKNGGRRRHRGGVAEAGKFGSKTRGRKNSPPARGSGKGGYYSMPNMNGVQGFATASSIKNPNKNRNKEPALERWESPDEYSTNNGHGRRNGHGGHRKRKPPHRGGSRKGKSRQNPRVFSDDDSPPPPDEHPESPEISPMPDTKPPDRNVHRRTNTPFKDIDLKMAQRRKSKEKIWGDANESHYDINTKNISGRNRTDSGKLVNTTPLAEGYEDRSSGDSDRDSRDSDDAIDEWKGKKGKGKKKGSKRPKRKDKKRKQSVGTVLKNKISNMRSGKKSKEDKKEAKKRKKSRERKEKEKKKEAKRKKEEEARRKKEEKEKEARRKKQEKAAKKMDVMKSLDQTKKDLKKSDGRKSKKDKTRRRSLGDVLKRKKKEESDDEEEDSKSKKNTKRPTDDDQKENGKTNIKITGTSSSNGRVKKKDKFRRRSTGEALKEQARKREEEEAAAAAKMTKSNTLRAPGQETNGSKSGRKSRKDKTRRKSVNDVIKGAFGSKKKTDDDQDEKEDTNTKKKGKDKGGRKSKKDKNRRVSLGNPFKWGQSKKNKDGEKSDDESDDEKPTKKPSIRKAATRSNETPSKRDQVRRRRNDRGPKKPTQIQTNTSASSEDSHSGDSKSKSKSKSKTSPKRKPRRNRDKSDELNRYKTKINAKTREKRRAAHRRKETPSYDINTKDILMQEYEKANFSGDESDDPNAVATDALSEDAETDGMYDASTPKAPPKGYRSYRKQQVEITKKGKAGKDTPKDSKTSTRGFRKRGSERGDDEEDRRDSGKTKGKGFKIQSINHPKKVQPAKTNDKIRKRVQIEEDEESADELTSESEYETDSESEYETTSSGSTGTGSTSSGSETDSETDSDSEYTSSDDETDSGDSDGTASSDTEDSVTRKALKAIMKSKKSMDEDDGDEMADYDWDAALKRNKKSGNNLENKRKNKQKELDKRHKEKLARQKKKKEEEAARKKKEEEDKRRKQKQKEAEEAKKEEERKQREREKQREEAARKKKQIEEERKKREKLELEEQERREKRQKLHEAEDDDEEDYEDEEEEYASDDDDFEDEESDDSGDTTSDEEESEVEDSLSSNRDDEQEELDAAMAAYVQLNSNDTSAIPEGNEHDDWVKQQAAIRLHKRKSTELWKWNTQQLIADENDESVADQKELNKMWMKLKTIPKSSKKDTTETRIVKEFMMFQLNHDHSIRDEYIVIENMNYPNIYEWNGMFVGPMGTPYVNGKYRILIKFPRDYPSKPPKITFLTKIYNSSVKHNKRKKRGLLRLPKFFDKIWSKKISLRQWLNVVYEFLFFYCGDHFFDPMNQRVAREFIFAFDSFIDTCYQWNLIFADGYDRTKNMIELHDEYGERQKLTFHLAKYSNQYDKQQYQFVKEIIWQTIRDKYHATYESFTVLLDYFGNEFYYCGLSELIREPHICVKHKVKRYDNIVNW